MDPTSSPLMARARASPIPPAISDASVCFTPLGSEVVPEV